MNNGNNIFMPDGKNAIHAEIEHAPGGGQALLDPTDTLFLLLDHQDKLQTFLCRLSKDLEPKHWQALVNASEEASASKAPELDHLARTDRAESVANWLDERGVAGAWDLAPTFVNVGLDSAWLAGLTDKLPPASHADALGWLEARLNLKSLVGQV